MLFKDASNTMVISLCVHTADVIFERGEWSSRWLRGRTARATVGQYTSGEKPRWSTVSEQAKTEANIETDFPMRFQVNLSKDPRKLELLLMAWPCRYGEATKEYKGLIGEGKR